MSAIHIPPFSGNLKSIGCFVPEAASRMSEGHVIHELDYRRDGCLAWRIRAITRRGKAAHFKLLRRAGNTWRVVATEWGSRAR